MSDAQPHSPRWLIYTQATSLAAIAVMAFFLVKDGRHNQAATTSNFPYIAKRLFLDNPNNVLINFNDLRKQIDDYLGASTDKIGVYFEYLPTGVSINNHGSDDFYRASLTKLPIVMRAYKLIEDKKLSLDETLTMQEKDIDRGFGELWKRGAGAKLTVRELITIILNQSDNTALDMLYNRVNVELLGDTAKGDKSTADVYDYLDIPREMSGITAMVTPKNYTSILKSLYFSAYLSYQDSNEILRIMTQPIDEHWMRTGVRSGIPVADKIGARNVEPSNLLVYSDCGIVYYPLRPYSLCVMVNSGDATASVNHIQDISKMVFNFIDKK